jgi:hypothetical protein
VNRKSTRCLSPACTLPFATGAPRSCGLVSEHIASTVRMVTGVGNVPSAATTSSKRAESTSPCDIHLYATTANVLSTLKHDPLQFHGRPHPVLRRQSHGDSCCFPGGCSLRREGRRNWPQRGKCFTCCPLRVARQLVTVDIASRHNLALSHVGYSTTKTRELGQQAGHVEQQRRRRLGRTKCAAI